MRTRLGLLPKNQKPKTKNDVICETFLVSPLRPFIGCAHIPFVTRCIRSAAFTLTHALRAAMAQTRIS
jgi:hypothetical protein